MKCVVWILYVLSLWHCWASRAPTGDSARLSVVKPRLRIAEVWASNLPPQQQENPQNFSIPEQNPTNCQDNFWCQPSRKMVITGPYPDLTDAQTGVEPESKHGEPAPHLHDVPCLWSAVYLLIRAPAPPSQEHECSNLSAIRSQPPRLHVKRDRVVNFNSKNKQSQTTKHRRDLFPVLLLAWHPWCLQQLVRGD